MNFAWPLALAALAIVPTLLALYIVGLRKKRKSAVLFSNVALVRAAMPAAAKWRRHVPSALLLTGLLGLGIAVGRPQASVKVPRASTSIMLALDVSRSMCATDVAPNRLAVAQAAARAFVKSQPSGTRIGIIAFAGYAELVVAPTTNKEELTEAIDGFVTARGTAIGAATLASLNAIASINPNVAPVTSTGLEDTPTDFPFDLSIPDTVVPDTEPSKAPPPTGGYVPDIIVLLTDGANTRGVDPTTAAKQAVERRVRVYTIGFGTTDPQSLVCTPEQIGGDALGDGACAGGGGGFARAGGAAGFRRFIDTDEPTLKKVAAMTGGNFYKAEDAPQLRRVFENLPKQVKLQQRDVEISVGFVAFGLIALLAALGLSLRWTRVL